MDTIPPHDFPRKPSPGNTYIYILIDPATNEIRYVGKTRDDVKDRLNSHVCEKGDTHKNHWIASLIQRGLKPLIQVVEEFPTQEWRERECYWIEYYRAQGCPLTNISPGGLGREYVAPETRAKISATLQGRDNGPEFRAKMKEVMAAKKGIKRPPEVGAKVSVARTGKKRAPFSEEWKRKIADANRGQVRTPEMRARMSLAKKKWHAMRKTPPSDAPTLWD